MEDGDVNERSLQGSYFNLLIPVDWIVNMICIALQFRFAKKWYLRLCGCLDACCRKVISQRTKQTMYKLSIEVASREIERTRSASPVTATAPSENVVNV